MALTISYKNIMDEFYNLNMNIINQKEYKELPKNLMVSESGNSEVYDHITFRIENLSDYMKIISIANVHRSFRDLLPTTVFRGMSNHN